MLGALSLPMLGSSWEGSSPQVVSTSCLSFAPYILSLPATTLLPGCMRAKRSSGQPSSMRRKVTPSTRHRWASGGLRRLCRVRPCSPHLLLLWLLSFTAR